MPLDRVVLGFLRDYWGVLLPSCSRPEVDLLGRVFSPGIRYKSLWQRQCRQMAKILEPFLPWNPGARSDQVPGDLKACWFAHSKGAEIAAINFSEKYLALPWTRDISAVEDVLVEFFSTRTHIPGKAIRTLVEQRPRCLILCITDTHIQNLYQEWDDIKRPRKRESSCSSA